MPELPEVTTTVNGLKKTIQGLVFSDVWTDLVKKETKKQFQKTIKNKKFFENFKKQIKGAKVLKIKRRAKNILIFLDNNQIILIHLKMTGHLIFGKYEKILNKNKKIISWKPNQKERPELHDPYNRFIHVVFSFQKNKNKLVFCDVRKFGKITLFSTKELNKKENDLFKLGPEPLENSFNYDKFEERLNLKKNMKIKTALMNQEIIAGIGNIYSDEMLWSSEIHPEAKFLNVPKNLRKKLFLMMKKVLKRGISLGGDSTSDYRDINGLKGNFQEQHNVYQRKNEKCRKKGCFGVIIRKVIDGRSAHFCNLHQGLFIK
jgi:formamidopyrimidine-DNA glycosylase